LEERLDPLYHFSTHFPDRLSALDVQYVQKASPEKKKAKSRIQRKNNPRYKTQPITFDEIQEVEEPETEKTTPTLSFLTELSQNTPNHLLDKTHKSIPRVEVEAASPDTDCTFPARMSFLTGPEFTAKIGSRNERKSNKSRLQRRRDNPRYKTQPITFDEIQEVEEPAVDTNGNTSETNVPNSMDLLFNPSSTKRSSHMV